jgi:hypothetical protein
LLPTGAVAGRDTYPPRYAASSSTKYCLEHEMGRNEYE